MSSTAALPKILCHECQRENEAERVYCHDCGARLDRSKVVMKKEPPVDVRKRVRKMFDPTRARIRALFFKTSKTILGAAAAGLVVVMLLPPSLPEPGKTEILASQVRIEMEDAIMRRQPTQIELTQEQVNAYLASALKTRKTGLNHPFLDFKRAVVVFSEGKCDITVERSVNGFYPVYTSASFGVSIANGKLVIEHEGGALGSLHLHPKSMPYLNAIFSDVWSALEPDSKLVARFNTLAFHDKRATLAITAPQ